MCVIGRSRIAAYDRTYPNITEFHSVFAFNMILSDFRSTVYAFSVK
jgi:hypothetical protein